MFTSQILLLSSISMIVSSEFSGKPTIEIIEMATKAGYPIEKHEILTEDGYILDIFRLPPRCLKNCTERGKNEPVLLMHGIISTAEVFVMSGNNSLGFLLNDRGYDVWLGNSRGNWHSRRHKTLDPDKDKEFWKFTWHEMGIYDLPPLIDYIRSVTSRERISYIGHSQGSTILFVLGSERPEYNDKLNIHIALAPATYLSNTKNPFIRLVTSFFDILKDLPDYFSVYEVEAIFRNRLLYTIAKTLCSSYNRILLGICKIVVDLVSDSNGNNLDENFLPQFIELLPGGSSVYQFLHFLQNSARGNFGQYNWGKEMNLKRYNSEYPRSYYNISMVRTPVVLYYGPNDVVTVPKDIQTLASSIPNLVYFSEVANKKWSHLDFLFGRNAVSLIHERIATSLEKYVPRKEL